MTIKEVFPYLRVKNCAAAIAYYIEVFGAKEKFRIQEPSGRIGHVELDFGHGYEVMLSDEYPEMGIVGPQSTGGAGMALHLHVDDADAYLAKAVQAGGTMLRGPADQPHGERSGTVRDPFGHEWYIGHTIEEMSPEEMKRRYGAV
jgi:PhnB protein